MNAVRQTAEDEERSINQVVRLVLRQAMEARGLLRRRRDVRNRIDSRVHSELPDPEYSLPHYQDAE